MGHWHHIIPKHIGGTDEPDNLVFLSVEEHAEAHRLLYEQYGRWQDYRAWQGLLKLIPREELIRLIQSDASKERHLRHKNPFSGVKTRFNFAINEEHRKRACELSKTPKAITKRKKVMADIKHQQGCRNSQYGKIWCVMENSINCENMKSFHLNEIPFGWISTTEFKDKNKDKNNPQYGKKWYNDHNKNYLLYNDDARIIDLCLVVGRLMAVN